MPTIFASNKVKRNWRRGIANEFLKVNVVAKLKFILCENLSRRPSCIYSKNIQRAASSGTEEIPRNFRNAKFHSKRTLLYLGNSVIDGCCCIICNYHSTFIFSLNQVLLTKRAGGSLENQTPIKSYYYDLNWLIIHCIFPFLITRLFNLFSICTTTYLANGGTRALTTQFLRILRQFLDKYVKYFLIIIEENPVWKLGK